MKRISIMQPYLFPYIGYFQLIKASDTFVSLDNVNFINKGWINRNRLIFNNKINLFTVPLEKASQNRLICNTNISHSNFEIWKIKFIKSITYFYKKYPYFYEGIEIIKKVFEKPLSTIAEMALTSLRICCNAFDIHTQIEISSQIPHDLKARNENKLISICNTLQADTYINLIGGKLLYRQEVFNKHNIQLQFLQPTLEEYSTGDRIFVPGLSILDVIFSCGCKRISYDYLNGVILEATDVI